MLERLTRNKILQRLCLLEVAKLSKAEVTRVERLWACSFAFPNQGFSFDKFIDDHGRRKLPTIRRSRGWFYLPTIRRSPGRFRTVLFTDDPTITFRFFWRKLPTIRRSQLGFFCESYRRSDDQIPVFLPKVTDDPTITTDDPTIILYRRSDDHFFDYFYRRSDDHLKDFYRRSDDHEYGFFG